LSLRTHFAFSPSIILDGYISGFSRGTNVVKNGDKISGREVNGKDGDGGSCYVYSGNDSNPVIYLDASTYSGDELIVMNEGEEALKIQIKSNYVNSSMNVMWVNGYNGTISEYILTKGSVIHAIYTGTYWHLW